MAPQVALPLYIANILKSLKAKSREDYAQLAIMGNPNAFPDPSVHILHKALLVSLRLNSYAEFVYTNSPPHHNTQRPSRSLESSSA